MSPKTALLAGTLCVAVGWLAGSQTAPRSGPAGQSGRPSGPRPLGVTTPEAPVAPLTRDLRSRLDRLPESPRPQRNPFRFRPAAPAAGADYHSESPRDPDEGHPGGETSPADGAGTGIVAPFGLTLAGIATETTDDGPRRTAIVKDGSTLLFVTTGDAVPGGFTAVVVDETSLTLRDRSGGERTLRLP